MKTYILTYNHCGNVNTYETQDLFRFTKKFEQVLDDSNILDSSISFNTIEVGNREVELVPEGFDYPFPKHKLYSNLK